MTLTAQAVVDSLATHAAAIRRQRNSLSRVHQLPAELLTNIFEIAINLTLDGFVDDLVTSRYQRLLKLASVSTVWNTVINHTPSLWSIVDDWCAIRLLPVVLRRSGEYPLEIRSSSMPGAIVDPDFHVQMAGHIHRWRTARITVVNSHELPSTAFRGPAPYLETLELAIMRPQVEDPALELHADNLPKLRHLRLVGVSLCGWTSSRITGLRSLAIGTPLPSGPSVQDVLEILSSNPLLERVNIYGLKGTPRLPPGSDCHPIVLGHLRTLNLQSLPPHHFDSLLRHIHAPICSSIRIVCSYPERPITFTLGPFLEPFITTLSSFLLDSSELQLRLGPSSLRFDAGMSPFNGVFNLELKGIPSLQPLQWLTAAFRNVLAVKSIKVDLEDGFNIADEAHRSLLWSLDGVTELEVKLGVRGINRLLQGLGRQTSASDGTPKWPLPHLQKLIIEPSEFNAFDMLRMVESRYGRESSGGHTATPDPFERLAFPSLTANVLEEVRNIVGRRNVSCGRLYSDSEADSDVDLMSDEVRIR